MIESLKSLLKSINRRPDPGVVRIRASEESFVALWKDGRNDEVKWSQVERIFTYKVDCYGYDMIWLAVERQGHDGALHIREEAEGFQDLMTAMGKALPEINPEWYFEVSLPPFAENLTLLFERHSEA